MSVLPGYQLSITRKRNDNSRLLKYANEKRLDDYFNDTTVRVGIKRIPANRMVLACYSDYFEDKFLIKGDYNPSVSITDMDEEPVEKLIEFIYTKEITINHENILSLFITAVKIKIDSAVQFCLEYFQSAINMENCYFILNEANLHKIHSLKEVAYKFMIENFHEVSENDKFKELSKDDLSSFISNIDRNKTSETFLYEAIIKWTKHNEEERKRIFSDLFLQLNLDQLPNDYLLHVVADESLVKKCLACSKVVLERMTLLMKLTKSERKILSLGGRETGSKLVEVFSLSNEDPKHYPDLPMKIRAHCSVNMGKTVFCIGGGLTEEWTNVTNKVWQMDMKYVSLEWEEIAAMNEKRQSLGAAVFNNVLVVVAGGNGKKAINSTEVYMKPFNRWDYISPLNQARGNQCVVTCGDWLYAIGGDSGGKNILSSVERLPTLHGKWEFTQSLLTPRMWFAAVCLKGTIFAIGGVSDSNAKLKSVEMFDPEKMTWNYVKDLNVARSSHAACVLDGKIYVVGGYNSSRHFVHEIECYDLSRDEWSIVGTTEEELSSHTLITV